MSGDGHSLDRVQSAIANAGKRAALAESLGVSEGQLSKIVSGELRRFCTLVELLGLEIYPADYVDALRKIVKEEL